MTYPEIILSMRLPKPPEIINVNAVFSRLPLAFKKLWIRNAKSHTIIIINAHWMRIFEELKKLKATPVFLTKRKSRIEGIIVKDE